MSHLARAAVLAALLILAAAALAIAVFLDGAYARDTGQWGQDKEMSDWFKSLRNTGGTPCCDNSDAIHVDPDDYWRNDDGSYTVIVGGKRETIDVGHIIHGNRVGYAILWKLSNGMTTCFMPGADI
jgi:hypothetical protein